MRRGFRGEAPAPIDRGTSEDLSLLVEVPLAEYPGDADGVDYYELTWTTEPDRFGKQTVKLACKAEIEGCASYGGGDAPPTHTVARQMDLQYTFLARAVNAHGEGEWSDKMTISSDTTQPSLSRSGSPSPVNPSLIKAANAVAASESPASAAAFAAAKCTAAGCVPDAFTSLLRRISDVQIISSFSEPGGARILTSPVSKVTCASIPFLRNLRARGVAATTHDHDDGVADVTGRGQEPLAELGVLLI